MLGSIARSIEPVDHATSLPEEVVRVSYAHAGLGTSGTMDASSAPAQSVRFPIPDLLGALPRRDVQRSTNLMAAPALFDQKTPIAPTAAPFGTGKIIGRTTPVGGIASIFGR